MDCVEDAQADHARAAEAEVSSFFTIGKGFVEYDTGFPLRARPTTSMRSPRLLVATGQWEGERRPERVERVIEQRRHD